MDTPFVETLLDLAEIATQTTQKQSVCVTDVRLIGKLIPWQLMCVIGAFTESTWRRCPNYTKYFLPEEPSVIDIQCNWEINSQMLKLCV